jgi:hypothetical protein
MSTHPRSIADRGVERSVALRLIALAAALVAIAAFERPSESRTLLVVLGLIAAEGHVFSWVMNSLIKVSAWRIWSIGPAVPIVGIAAFAYYGLSDNLEGDTLIISVSIVAASGFLARSRASLYMSMALSAVSLAAASEYHDATLLFALAGGYGALVLAFLATATALDAARGAVSRTRWTATARLATFLVYSALIVGLGALFFSLLPWGGDATVAQASPGNADDGSSEQLDTSGPTLDAPTGEAPTDSGQPTLSIAPVSDGPTSRQPRPSGGEVAAARSPTAPESGLPPSSPDEVSGTLATSDRPASESVLPEGGATASGPEPVGLEEPVSLDVNSGDQGTDPQQPGAEQEQAEVASDAPPETASQVPPGEGGPTPSPAPETAPDPQPSGAEEGSESEGQAEGSSWRIGDDVRGVLTGWTELDASSARRLAIGGSVVAGLVGIGATVMVRRGHVRGGVRSPMSAGEIGSKEREEVLAEYYKLEALLSKGGFTSRADSETPARYLSRVGDELPGPLKEDFRGLASVVSEAAYSPDSPEADRVAMARDFARRLIASLSV